MFHPPDIYRIECLTEDDMTRLPTLKALPSPPTGRNGWPWHQGSSPAPDARAVDTLLPRVSIITPSFNQAAYLETTIRSVLMQGYPNLEYIVIDGGSSDGSVEIIRKYEPWLAYWVSEPDKGQADALRKGFAKATGSIVAWLNSDDWYLPNVIRERVGWLAENPASILVYGDCHFVDEEGNLLKTWTAKPCSTKTLLLTGNKIPQQSTFMRSTAFRAAGGVDPALHYIMDYDLWVRLSLLGKLSYVPGPVANFRFHGDSKSVSVGYKFMLETLTWMDACVEIKGVLSSEDREEMYTRAHLKTAVEYLLAGQEAEAIHHLRISLENYPGFFEEVDFLVDQLVDASGLGGHGMHDSWENYERLGSVLRAVLPPAKARHIWRRCASRYFMKRYFEGSKSAHQQDLRADLLRGVWYDPRWLRNIGVWSILGHNILGNPRSGSLPETTG